MLHVLLPLSRGEQTAAVVNKQGRNMEPPHAHCLEGTTCGAFAEWEQRMVCSDGCQAHQCCRLQAEYNPPPEIASLQNHCGS